MSAPRAIVAPVSVAGWVYSWILLRGLREEFAVTGSRAPAWLLISMGLVSTALVATAVVTWLRVPVWPWMAIAASVAFAAIAVLNEQAILQAGLDFAHRASGTPAPTVTLEFALRALLRTRSTPGVVLLTGVPVLLGLGGAAGLAVSQLGPR